MSKNGKHGEFLSKNESPEMVRRDQSNGTMERQRLVERNREITTSNEREGQH